MSSSHGTTTTAAAANVVAVVVEGEATTTKAAKENTLKKRETLTDEYEPPFGLRNVDCISVRRLNVLDAFFKDDDDDDDDDDGNNNDNIASQLNSIEVYFTLKRIVKDSSVFLGGGISKSSKHEQNSIRVCDDSLKTFTSKAISFKKDNKSVCDPDWDIFEKEQRRFREVLERDGIDDEEEEEALVPGLFEFAVYGRRVKEHTSNSSNESSSSHDDDEEDEEENEKEKEKEKEQIAVE